MPIDQRLRLVEDSWNSITPAWHKTALETRLQEYYANPNEGSPWSEVKQRIIG
ncbi:addiction module protein [Candidatus Thiosymbion oneisti]|uniref:addiction module protein n=1 Tax=Candidatus Thiosymbion oneisti TaxID=589554 RepID=UPI001A9C5A0F|nr:addiction module protein [Candidatus Thiosymbion oneisti]